MSIKRGFFSHKRKVTIAMVGLDNAGKTSILNFLVEGEATETIPTVGSNFQKIKLKKLELSLIDLGGQKPFRQYWAGSIKQSQCMIFVIDSTDMNRFDEAKDEFNKALKLFPSKFPVLILANKQDLPTAASRDEIINKFELDNLSKVDDRDWCLVLSSAITGLGLSASFHWLYERLTGEELGIVVPQDILVFNKNGIPIVIKSEVFKEGRLAAGFLSAINSFVVAVAEDELSSIIMGKNKIIFHHDGDVIGVMILRINDIEEQAQELLKKLVRLIIENGVDKAEQTLARFVIRELKSI
ncbi:MAG: ADP-ribosylation factor family protein [Promethearchaeota archaeon]